jgi:hypothetical protein
MPIDISTEPLITLAAAARQLGLPYGTVYGWARYGAGGRRNPGGPTLEVELIGTQKMRTSIAACQRYMAQLKSLRDARDVAASRGASR